jgi:hypothetical protein
MALQLLDWECLTPIPITRKKETRPLASICGSYWKTYGEHKKGKFPGHFKFLVCSQDTHWHKECQCFSWFSDLIHAHDTNDTKTQKNCCLYSKIVKQIHAGDLHLWRNNQFLRPLNFLEFINGKVVCGDPRIIHSGEPLHHWISNSRLLNQTIHTKTDQ